MNQEELKKQSSVSNVNTTPDFIKVGNNTEDINNDFEIVFENHVFSFLSSLTFT